MPFQFFHSGLRNSKSQTVTALGVSLRVLLSSSDSDGALTIMETMNAPGFGPPLQRHPKTEVFRVMEGCYVFEVDGNLVKAHAGDVGLCPEERRIGSSMLVMSRRGNWW